MIFLLIIAVAWDWTSVKAADDDIARQTLNQRAVEAAFGRAGVIDERVAIARRGS
jgi:hypothetical protein